MSNKALLRCGGTACSTALLAVLLALAACGSGVGGAPGRVRVDRRSPAASSSARVTYNGGTVLSAAEIVVVFWGSDLPQSVAVGTPGIYRTLAERSDFDWISEYDTPTQHIGRAKLTGQVVIDPGDAGTELLDVDIVAELARQLDAGVLPPATENSYYAVYFPKTVSISQGFWLDRSCEAWEAYHGDLAPFAPGTYAVFPSCGRDSPDAVHELFEAMTDPHDSSGWTDQVDGYEIADLCADSHTSLPLRDGGSFPIQRLWSNVANACLASGNEFTLAVAPAAAVAGPEVSFTVSMALPRNPFTQLSWDVSGLPIGATYSIVQRTDDPRHWTLTLRLPQPSQDFPVTVEARTESWTASAEARLYLASSSSGPTGCSQASGTPWPAGLVALIALGWARRRT